MAQFWHFAIRRDCFTLARFQIWQVLTVLIFMFLPFLSWQLPILFLDSGVAFFFNFCLVAYPICFRNMATAETFRQIR